MDGLIKHQYLNETAANLIPNITDTRKRIANTLAKIAAPFAYAIYGTSKCKAPFPRGPTTCG